MTTIYVLNGPNLNLLGRIDRAAAGAPMLEQVEQRLRLRAVAAAVDIVFLQTNHEGDLVDWIQEAGASGAPVILNAGAYTHTSIALQDAIRGAATTVVEVHLDNGHLAHDAVRRRSYISPVAKGVITGFGPRVYELALDALLPAVAKQSDPR